MKKKEGKESSALCHTANIISKAHPFCAAVTCIPPKSSSSSRLRLRLPIIEKKMNNHKTATQSPSPIISKREHCRLWKVKSLGFRPINYN